MGSTPWRTIALLCCFSTTGYAALPDIPSGPCFPDAIKAATRKNVSVGEGLASMPLKLASVTWVSGSLLHHAARIIFREKLGYNVEFAPDVGQSRQTWMQVADCNSTDPTDKCFQGAPGSVAHLAFEIWESYAAGMAEKLAVEVPGRVPFVVGAMGSLGTEAFFIRQAIVDQAVSEKKLFLDWYTSYNVSWSEAYKYFASHTDLPVPDTKCNDSSYMQGTYLDGYERLTGDSQAIIVDPVTKKKTRKCDANGWALSPACRKLMLSGVKGCIPAICYGGWGFHDLAQKAAFFDMPLALGAYGWTQYIAIPKANSTLTYWWTPDTALLNSDPVEVIFPAYDSDEYGKGNYRSAMAGTKLQKISSAVIANEVLVQQFVQRLKISIQSIMKFSRLALGLNATEHEQIACSWLKNNPTLWAPWLPDPTDCILKQGLMDNMGNFMTEANAANATKCEFCATGRRSDDIQTAKGRNFICKQCEVGQFQKNLGATRCAMCGAGRFQPETGKDTCLRCPMGTYTQTDGATACTSCQTQLEGSSTKFQGASSPGDCVCMEGAYDGRLLHGSKSCVSCGEGLRCDQKGLVKPFQAKGYYVHNNNPKDVFRCNPPEACGGANWSDSVCRAPRSGFLCTKCPGSQTSVGDLDDPSQAGCSECSVFALVIVSVAPFLVIVILLRMAYKEHHSTLDDNPIFTEAQNTIGQMIMFVQVINACFAAGVTYSDPLVSFMDNTLAFVDPDQVLGNAPCLGEFMKEPVFQYALNVVSPLALMACMGVAFLISKLSCGGVLAFDAIFNVIGEVLVEFYISVTLAIFAPFDCYAHPNGDQSLQKYAQVLCGESEHGAMIGLAVFGILAYPVNAIVLSLYMTWKLPQAMLKSELRILIRCHFLFGRWKPQTCWFCNVTILRNFFIAVLPMVMPQDQLDVTIVLMILTLGIALILVVWFKPRRSRSQNLLDVFISYVQLIIATFGLSSVHGLPVSELLSAFLLILLVLVVCIVVSMLALKAYQLGTPSGKTQSQWRVYVSHHAGAGGIAARVLHSMLEKTIGRVFYDIDNLQNDTLLIDAIKTSSNLLVIFGSETCCRTWCIGAIVVAYRKSIPMQSVAFTDLRATEPVDGATAQDNSYVKKSYTASFGKAKKNSLVEVDCLSLRGHGVEQTWVHPAIEALMKVESTFMNLRDKTDVETSIREIVDAVFEGSTGMPACPVDTALATFFGAGQAADKDKESLVSERLIMIDRFDGEAVAVSRLLRSAFLLIGSSSWLQDQDMSSTDFARIVKTGQVGVVALIFSKRTLTSAAQLARWGLLTKLNATVHVVPIVAGVTFDFPDDQYLIDLQVGKVLALGSNTKEQLSLLAGEEVSLKNIADGLTYLMNFLVTFINVAQLNPNSMNKVIAETLARATSKRGLRTSKVSSLGDEQAVPQAAPPEAEEEHV